jgi:hypothetical protein
MRASQPRRMRMLLVLILAVALAVPSVAAARPLPGGASARPAISHAGLSWLTQAWSWLRGLWLSAGPGGDSNGLDEGPGIDPNG